MSALAGAVWQMVKSLFELKKKEQTQEISIRVQNSDGTYTEIKITDDSFSSEQAERILSELLKQKDNGDEQGGIGGQRQREEANARETDK